MQSEQRAKTVVLVLLNFPRDFRRSMADVVACDILRQKNSDYDHLHERERDHEG
jgi:hypothetical protein